MNDDNGVDQSAPFDAAFQRLGEHDNIFIGYSGGLDSTVLLHSFSDYAIRTGFSGSLTAIHINHQLDSDSDRWQQHCEAFCTKLGVAFSAHKVTLTEQGKGLESAARDARYAVFEKLLHDAPQTSPLLLMAHHADDQAETLLLRLFRGAGTAGAAAIPASRALAGGTLARPLLAFSRHSLHDYAQHHHLEYIDDPSNLDTRFDRNYIRHELLPAIELRWPNVVAALSRYTGHAARDAALLTELAQLDIESIEQGESVYGRYIAVEPLLLLADARRDNVIRYWLAGMGLSMPGQKVLAQFHQFFVDDSDSGGTPELLLGRYAIARFRQYLYCYDTQRLKAVSDVLEEGVAWSSEDALELPGLGHLSAAERGIGIGIAAGRYRLGKRRDGLQFRAGGMTRTLKKWLNEQGVPPWFRDCYPMLYCDNVLVAIPGDLICEDFQVEGGLALQWEWRAALSP